jgi:hypothetical protein
LLETSLSTLSQPKPKAHLSKEARNVLREFRTTYADCMVRRLTPAVWRRVAQKRRLQWKSDIRLSLPDAALCYGQMKTNYNLFEPRFIADLAEAFPDADITVTPAREYSVAVYLHVPDVADLRQRVEQFVNERFSADEVLWQTPETLLCWWD